MEPSLKDAIPAIETTWVVVAAVFVLFMQAGFLLLEVGFSRMKNAGTVVPKVLANLSVAALCYWAVGFALAFGGAGWFAGTEGTFLGTNNGDLFPAMAFSSATVPAKFFFQFVFCAVSLAIVWGTTLERIKFGAYLIYAVVFSCADLSDHQPLDLRRRLAAVELRHAGLRRLDRGPPDRGHRRARGPAPARPAAGQVRPATASRT